MTDDQVSSRLAVLLSILTPKTKPPVSTKSSTPGSPKPRENLVRRGEVEVVNVPAKIIKPRRFTIILQLRGVTWRRIQFEVSADEAGIGGDSEGIEPPPLSGFGLPDPDALVGIAMRFQIA